MEMAIPFRYITELELYKTRRRTGQVVGFTGF